MNLIIEEFHRVCPEMKTFPKKKLTKWYYRFLKRYNLKINKKYILGFNFKLSEKVKLFNIYISIQFQYYMKKKYYL